ncbi:MAG: hypothetical protein WCA81_05700 [Rhizomicrobium sp.]
MKLIARIATELGPRTTVQQGLSQYEASALARAIEAQGGAARILDDGHVLSLASKMHKRKRDKARRKSKTGADDMTNVTVPTRGDCKTIGSQSDQNSFGLD